MLSQTCFKATAIATNSIANGQTLDAEQINLQRVISVSESSKHDDDEFVY